MKLSRTLSMANAAAAAAAAAAAPGSREDAMPLLTYLPARARTRSPRLRALGVGVCLLAGAALIAVPACAAGNSSEQNGVHLVSGHAANAAIGAAVMRPDPNYVDG